MGHDGVFAGRLMFQTSIDPGRICVRNVRSSLLGVMRARTYEMRVASVVFICLSRGGIDRSLRMFRVNIYRRMPLARFGVAIKCSPDWGLQSLGVYGVGRFGRTTPGWRTSSIAGLLLAGTNVVFVTRVLFVQILYPVGHIRVSVHGPKDT